MRAPSILFVCMHNACRSQIAEALCRSKAPSSWALSSAGLRPSEGVDPKAARILEEHGLRIREAKPKGFDSLGGREWDCVVEVGCPPAKGLVPAREIRHWNIADPLDGPMELYVELYAKLEKQVAELIVEFRKTTGH
ncbi:MAG: low molecular weight phosphatase family protein [Elusimicrobiota bacterium]